MKRYLVLVLTGLCVLFAAIPAAAARPALKFPVTFNGHPVVFDVQPEVVPPGHTMVPLRAIVEKMGANVDYNNATKMVTTTRGSITVTLTIGSLTATVGGTEQRLPVAPYIREGRTLVPLRFLSEALGAEVSYDGATTAIAIVDSTWPRRGGDLNLALPHKPEGPLNPIITNDAYGNDLIGMIYDGLWRYDDRFMPVPALAESWAWSEGDTKLTFYIRKGVRFFDGRELTADDVVFTFKAMAHPQYSGALNAGYDGVLGWSDYHNASRGESAADFAAGKVSTAGLDGLYAADHYSVVFKLSKADGPFFFRNTGTGIVDHSKYQAIPVQDWGTARDPYNAKPNGTGAFSMDQYKDGELAILTANEHYWAGRPYVDRVIFRVVTADVAISDLQSGKLDVAELGAGDLGADQAMRNVTVHQLKDAVFQSMGMNTARGITSDLAVRQAISYGIDRQAIIHNLLKEHASAMYGPAHPPTWNDIPHYDYNPTTARRLLEGAGWQVGAGGIRERNGQKLKLRLAYPTDGNTARIATARFVQQLMKEIGIEIELQGYDWPAMAAKVFTEHDFDLYFSGWRAGGADADPTGQWDKASVLAGGNNPGGWWDAQSEELIARGRATNDVDERQAIYHEWVKHFMESAPAYFFYSTDTLIARNNRLQNFRPSPWGAYWNVAELWLDR